jgi:hypothetical protein
MEQSSSFIPLLNKLTTYVKELRTHYELEKAQEWQKGYSTKQMQIEEQEIKT